MKKFLKYAFLLFIASGIILSDNYFTANFGTGIGDIVQGITTAFFAIGAYASGRLDEAKERDQN